jgi:hypothetical protein
MNNRLFGAILAAVSAYFLFKKEDAKTLQGSLSGANLTGCPKATQDLLLNTQNRNAAIKNPLISYGPANPTVENAQFWNEYAASFKPEGSIPTKEDIKAAKGMRCGNCVAFDVSPRMLKCLPPTDTYDAMALESKAVLGYCWMHHFKCASTRTCRTWAAKGPITKDKVSYEWQRKSQV